MRSTVSLAVHISNLRQGHSVAMLNIETAIWEGEGTKKGSTILTPASFFPGLLLGNLI